ncbi:MULTISPECIES: tetratricopeptide repeat protein [Stenotrophomonas]|uniref:tetratricopeptide repeat protein n=1 Tax=Stenotrophomonas TaxID=40323 RepID=UPI0007704DF8|nr:MULTISPECIES: tetratricopeptide repeat protein [Stenotrophomonas]AMJ58731.1 UDP-N-acetylglucosamine-peptide N-acetylglucosaminyltransferase [Stenotrophomonas sp. KCTC 12332]
MIGWNALVLLAASSVALAAPAPAASPAAAVPAPAQVPTPQQVMAIPPEVRAQLQERVLKVANSPEQRLHLLVELVFRPEGMGLEYDTEATLTVAETWQQHRANCLSFTLLFVALAREIGLEARMQEVGQVVSWYQDQGLIFNAGHVNVGMRVDGRSATLDLDSNVLYDRRGPQPINDSRALAHFYNNRGAEQLAVHDYAGARAYFAAALRMDARFVPAWSNLGVLESRENDLDAASKDLETALAISPSHAPALHNATKLYQRMGNTRRVTQLQARLEQVRKRDPFYQFMQGNSAERDGDYALATHYYRQAVRLYDHAHQFHFGLARAYFLSGNNRLAEREMKRARDLGGDPLRAVYQSKLDGIRRLEARHAAR